MPVPPLRNDQADTKRGCGQAFRDGAMRVMVASPTRSGKTVIAGSIVEDILPTGKRVGFYVWSRQIMDQTVQSFEEWGIPVTRFAAGHDYDPACPVFVAMAQTIRSREGRVRPPSADWMICDEAHQVNYDGIIRDAASHTARVIGLSATPIDEKGYGLGRKNLKGRGYDALVQGASYEMLRGIGALVPCVVYSPDGDAVFESMKANPKALQSAARALLGDRELIGNPIEHWLKKADGRPTVMFVDGVEASKGWADKFNDAGIPAIHVDGDTSDAERRRIRREFDAGNCKVLVNDSVFTVGWDAPICSCVIMYRKVGSLRLWRQAGARAMGSNPGKSDCVVLDHGGTALAFGPPDMDIQWPLDGRTNAAEELAKERAEKIKSGEIEPTVCPSCGAWRENRGPTCPYCGHVATTKGKAGLWLAGHLTRLDERIGKMAATETQRKWESLLHWGAATGATVKQCVARFMRDTEKHPFDMQLLYAPPPKDWKAGNMKVADWAPRFDKMRERERQLDRAAEVLRRNSEKRAARLEQFDVPAEIRQRGPNAVDFYINKKLAGHVLPASKQEELFDDKLA